MASPRFAIASRARAMPRSKGVSAGAWSPPCSSAAQGLGGVLVVVEGEQG